MQKIELNSLEDTKKLAIKLASLFKQGDVVCLEGSIGAGKTTFTSFLLKELGVKEDITSPTFAIVVPYDATEFKVFHSDVYRIDDEEELYNIGFEDYFREDAVILIEWADTIMEYIEELSDKLISLRFEVLSPEKRTLEIEFFDDRSLTW